MAKAEIEKGGESAFAATVVHGRGLHSSTFQLNLIRFRHYVYPKHPLIPPNTP